MVYFDPFRIEIHHIKLKQEGANQKMKRITRLTALLLALALLGGCTGGPAASQAGPGKPAQSGNETAEPVQTGADQPAQTGNETAEPGQTGPVTTHIREDLGEGLTVDLELTVPAPDAQPKVYAAQFPVLDEETVADFWEALGRTETEVVPCEDWVGKKVYKSLSDTDGVLMYMYSVSDDHGNPVYELSYVEHTVHDYNFAVRDYNVNRFEYPEDNTAFYTEERDFSFMSCKDALAWAERLLQSLGISNVSLRESFYLDHTKLNEMLANESSAWYIEMNHGQEFAKTGYDEADDAYVFHFDVTIDGIPVIADNFELTTLYYEAPSVHIKINRQGVYELWAMKPWQVGEALPTTGTLIDGNEILARVKTLAQNQLSACDRVIDTAALRYLPWQDGDRWILKPVWYVSILNRNAVTYHRSETDSYLADTRTWYLFDAYTGEQIA